MSNEDLDLHGHPDGFAVSYRGRIIWTGRTWTGACRAMTAAREAYRALTEQARKVAA